MYISMQRKSDFLLKGVFKTYWVQNQTYHILNEFMKTQNKPIVLTCSTLDVRQVITGTKQR